MKRVLALVFVLSFSCCLHAQAVDTTVCEILKNPAAFNGKIVRVKATVVAGFDQFVLKGAGCGVELNDIWLSYPEGVKGKAGPAVMVQIQPAQNFAGTVAAAERAPVQLDKKDKSFKEFDSLLAAAPKKSGGMCLGCNRNEVTATLVGRLDGVADPSLARDKAGKVTSLGGFGFMNAYSARLVLQSVSDVTSQEVDYSKAQAVTKEDTGADVGSGDWKADLQKIAQIYPAGNPSGVQLTRAVAVYGKPNEKNGVSIGFGVGNEAIARFEAKGVGDSPDGLLYNCTFNTSRASGDAEARAILFTGENIANVRSPLPESAGASFFVLEYRAWFTTVLSAIASRQKTMTLPGGNLVWSSTWLGPDVNQKLGDAVANYLTAEELIHR
jgi:hypothetical protein